jgi:hypothetical protein
VEELFEGFPSIEGIANGLGELGFSRDAGQRVLPEFVEIGDDCGRDLLGKRCIDPIWR